MAVMSVQSYIKFLFCTMFSEKKYPKPFFEDFGFFLQLQRGCLKSRSRHCEPSGEAIQSINFHCIALACSL